VQLACAGDEAGLPTAPLSTSMGLEGLGDAAALGPGDATGTVGDAASDEGDDGLEGVGVCRGGEETGLCREGDGLDDGGEAVGEGGDGE